MPKAGVDGAPAGAEAATAVALLATSSESIVAAVDGDLSLSLVDDAGERQRHTPTSSPDAVVVCGGEATSLPAQVEETAERFEGVPVVAVCRDDQRPSIRLVLAAGAAGVVLEQEIGDALRPCLRAVMAGLMCLPAGGWRQIEPPALSSREKQVLGLVVLGYMNSQIAKQLFLAESTVKSHLSSAFGKLGVRSRHEAVARILDPKEGLGVGILGLGGEPLQTVELQA
jgi:DNA-binding NarL/FixJ family response regulator